MIDFLLFHPGSQSSLALSVLRYKLELGMRVVYVQVSHQPWEWVRGTAMLGKARRMGHVEEAPAAADAKPERKKSDIAKPTKDGDPKPASEVTTRSRTRSLTALDFMVSSKGPSTDRSSTRS